MLSDLIHEKIDERVLDTFPEFHLAEVISENFDYQGINENFSCRCVLPSHINDWTIKFKRTLTEFIPNDIHCFVAGGSVLTYILYGNDLLINDYDIFPSSQETYDKIHAHLIGMKATNVLANDNCTRFSFPYIEIDLIKKTFSSLDVLMDNFDINICKVGFDVKNGFWKFEKKVSFSKIFSRKFHMNYKKKMDFKVEGIKVLQRLVKYCAKGFWPDQKTLTGLYANILTAGFDAANDEIPDPVQKEEAIKLVMEGLAEHLGKDYKFTETDNFGPIAVTIPVSSIPSGSPTWI
jgi:hypothetical protein